MSWDALDITILGPALLAGLLVGQILWVGMDQLWPIALLYIVWTLAVLGMVSGHFMPRRM
ncbi:hypothetical protein MNBD_GAMMA24-2664 [hydrothermal vent metagenome]|uniref:Uncharacterized protein n=1 Tax=hydrothermal vent metagenome TaxID=652676 RepID=A0A3B1BTX5_9ZZZZ